MTRKAGMGAVSLAWRIYGIASAKNLRGTSFGAIRLENGLFRKGLCRDCRPRPSAERSSAESGPCHLPLEPMKFGESAKIFRVCRDDCDTAPSRAGCDQRVIGQAASPDLFVIVFEGQPVQ